MIYEKKYIFQMLVFPITFIYFEILLRLFGGHEFMTNLGYPVLFSVGMGFLFSCITTLFSDKMNYILTTVCIILIGIIFITETLIFSSFKFYMAPGSISSVTSNVANDYLDQVFITILRGIPVVVLFLMPAVLYLLFGKKYISTEKSGKTVTIVLLLAALIISGIAIVLSSVGRLSEEYKAQYKFDTAVKNFGLISSLQLETYYGIFGNSAAENFIILTDEPPVDVDPSEDKKDPMEDSKDNNRNEEKSPQDQVTDDKDPETEHEENTEENIVEEAVEIIYEKNMMDLPLDEISASVSNQTVISMNEYVKSLEASSQNQYTGLFKGKNLILICAEAFSHAAIDKDLTPTLYRLAHNGFYFSDYYQPSWNGSTSTGEYSMLMGIAPLIDVRTMPATEGHNLYFTMGNQLQRIGYTGNAYHNGGYKYYSRNLTHENLGYDNYIAQGSGLEDLASPWPSDKEMFMGTVPTYIDKQPFSVYYMSVSGHFPYKKDDPKTAEYIDYVREKVGDKYKENTLYYLCYQMELEDSLTYLVQQLEKKGIADDTVICITADHYPYGLEHSSTYGTSEDYIGDLYGEYPKNAWERDKNAWILWSGCLENEHKDMACEISEPTYSLDILPTLSNLFGLEYDSRLLVGRDVFSEEEPLAIWVNHTWVSNLGQYDSNKDIFYPNEGVEIPDGYIEKINTIVSNKLSFSGKILDYDYYEILFPRKNK